MAMTRLDSELTSSSQEETVAIIVVLLLNEQLNLMIRILNGYNGFNYSDRLAAQKSAILRRVSTLLL